MLPLIWMAVPDWLDFEVVTIFAIAIAGVGMMYRDAKADRYAHDLAERVAALEAATSSGNPTTLAERVAALETGLDLAQRLAVVEARIDHQPIRQTRKKDGKFTKADDPEGKRDP